MSVCWVGEGLVVVVLVRVVVTFVCGRLERRGKRRWWRPVHLLAYLAKSIADRRERWGRLEGVFLVTAAMTCSWLGLSARRGYFVWLGKKLYVSRWVPPRAFLGDTSAVP